VAEATELRNGEKKMNQNIIKDAREGQSATQQAIRILEDFYGGANAALVQTSTKSGAKSRSSNAVRNTIKFCMCVH